MALFGKGLGRSTNATRLFGEVQLIETYHPQNIVRDWPPGLLAVLVLYTTLIVAVYKAYRATKEPDLRGMPPQCGCLYYLSAISPITMLWTSIRLMFITG